MKVHIIGQAGSGKTTLARWLAERDGSVAFDLDIVVYGPRGERTHAERTALVAAILEHEGWVAEGAYREEWLSPLLNEAEVIVWLDLPLRVCLWRIFRRHVAAEFRRNNPHPGWRKLAGFMRYTWQADRSSRVEVQRLLRGYGVKVVRLRSGGKVRRWQRTVSRRGDAPGGV